MISNTELTAHTILSALEIYINPSKLGGIREESIEDQLDELMEVLFYGFSKKEKAEVPGRAVEEGEDQDGVSPRKDNRRVEHASSMPGRFPSTYEQEIQVSDIWNKFPRFVESENEDPVAFYRKQRSSAYVAFWSEIFITARIYGYIVKEPVVSLEEIYRTEGIPVEVADVYPRADGYLEDLFRGAQGNPPGGAYLQPEHTRDQAPPYGRRSGEERGYHHEDRPE